MFTGWTPFSAEDDVDVYDNILTGDIDVNVPGLVGLPLAVDFVTKLLHKTATKRLGGSRRGGRDVWEHEWLSEYRGPSAEWIPPWIPEIHDVK